MVCSPIRDYSARYPEESLTTSGCADDSIAVSIVGIICQARGVLCESEGFNVHFANVYLEAIDFVSIRYLSI